MTLAMIMPPLHPMPPCPGGGVERLCDIFLRANETARNPIEITVFCRADDRARDAAQSFVHTKFVYIDVTKSEPMSNQLECRIRKRLGQPTSLRFDYLRGLKKALRGRAFDDILIENAYPYVKPIAKLAGRPVIYHAHNVFWGEDIPDYRKSTKYIRKFLFVSEFLMTEAVKAGIPAARSQVLCDCVETDRFDAALYTDIRHGKRAKYGIADEDLLAVFVGRLIPEKGAVELVKALARTTFAGTGLKLLLVGSAEYGENIRDEYREMLEKEAPEGRVIFIGSVKPASTARFLARADFAVVPSVWDEPAGLPVLEAMSTGLPLIVSDSGGIGEYTAALKNTDVCLTVKRGLGYVNSLTKAIDTMAERLYNDPAFRSRAAKEAREAAMAFDAGSYYEHVLRAIE